MKKTLVVTIILQILFVAISAAQSPYFTNYTEKDGLSSNHVYKVFQDSKGYIWFATSKGVTRFDSEEFETFDSSDGLTDYEIIAIYEDSSSRIWFATFNGLPCYYHAGKIYNYQNDSLLKKVELKDFIKSIYEDSDQNIWLGGSRNNTVSINYADLQIDKYDRAAYIIHENDKQEVILHEMLRNEINLSTTPYKNTQIPLGANTSDINVFGISASLILHSKSLIFSIQNKIYLKPPSCDSIHEINQNIGLEKGAYIRNMFQDDRGNVFIASTNGAFICKLDEGSKQMEVRHRLLADENITSFISDHQDGYWISSQDGVYHFKNDQVLQIMTEIGATNLLGINNDFIVVAEPNSKISLLDIHSFQKLKTFTTETEPKAINNINGNIYVITEADVYKVVGDSLIKIFFNHSGKDLEIIGGDYLLATHSGIFAMDIDEVDKGMFQNVRLLSSEKVQLIYDKRVFKLFKVNGRIYASTVEGILIFNEILEKTGNQSATKNFRPNDIISFNDKIVLSTYQDGIYISINEQVMDTINVADGLISNQVLKTIDYNNRLYVITDEGIQYLDDEMRPQNILGLTNLDAKINGAEIFNDDLLLSTSEGILSYNLSSILERENSFKSDIVISQNNKQIENFDTLQYNENSIEVKFHFFDFAKMTTNLKYRLYPESKEWKPVTAKQILYQGLMPDRYIFQLKSEDKAVAERTFYIDKPLWMELWFKVLTGILLLLLIYFGVRYRFGQKLKKQEKEHAFKIKLATAEQEALKAQMNPHFIFNSLNAIQNLILRERTNDAYQYLGNFSRLVRKVLVDSMNIGTTIKKEIEFLTLYLNLEALRFENQFHFSFEHKDGLNLDYKIPAMVIQPFVENAIIHGLVPQSNAKRPEIIISFEEDSRYIYCNIQDNGVGFSPTTPKATSKNSLGLKLISERLELYDTSGMSSFQVHSSADGTTIKLQVIKLT